MSDLNYASRTQAYDTTDYDETRSTSFDIVSAVFNDSDDANRAVDWLRDNGVPERAISVVSRRGDQYAATGDMAEHADGEDTAKDTGKGTLIGAGVGAGVGALFGLAAFAIPGLAPFVAAGALAETLGAAGGMAAAGAIVGATSGALAGAFSAWGLSEDEAHYYAGEVERGGVYVGVDLSQTALSRESVTDAFRRYNGRFHM
ncbi:MAG: hypothetical protein ACK47B_23355 [Armatimonadota bacterium]